MSRRAYSHALGYAAAALVVTISTGVGLAFAREQTADVVMLYLLGVVIVAMRFGYGPSLASAVLAVIAFDFFFVLPYYSLAVSDLRHIVTFVVMFVVAVVISNLTQRLRRQSEAAHRARLRVETEQLRNALLSSVSHDLRTPLAVVTGATSALLEPSAPKDEAKRRELLETAHDEAQRLSRLVNNLLDMTRLEAGALKVQKQAQPIEEIVGAALERMESRLRGREIETDIPADLPLVPHDSVLIEQVLMNLLENATKHTPVGSPIAIAARASENEVEVEVDDRGPGVPEADAERVFDKFYRAREGEGGGVGLGLTICRGIIEAHGGRIWVERRDGGGSRFRFTLPQTRDP